MERMDGRKRGVLRFTGGGVRRGEFIFARHNAATLASTCITPPRFRSPPPAEKKGILQWKLEVAALEKWLRENPCKLQVLSPALHPLASQIQTDAHPPLLHRRRSPPKTIS